MKSKKIAIDNSADKTNQDNCFFYLRTSTLPERIAQVRNIKYFDIYSDSYYMEDAFIMDISYFFKDIDWTGSTDTVISSNGISVMSVENIITSHFRERFPNINFIGIIYFNELGNSTKLEVLIINKIMALFERIQALEIKNDSKENYEKLIENEVSVDHSSSAEHIDLTVEPGEENNSNCEFLPVKDEEYLYEALCAEEGCDNYLKSNPENQRRFEEWLQSTEKNPNKEYVCVEEGVEIKVEIPRTVSLSSPNLVKNTSALSAIEASYSSMDIQTSNVPSLIRRLNSNIGEINKKNAMQKAVEEGKLKSSLFNYNELMGFASKQKTRPGAKAKFPWRSDDGADDVIVVDGPVQPEFDSNFTIPKKTYSSCTSPRSSNVSELMQDIKMLDDETWNNTKQMYSEAERIQRDSFFEEQKRALRKIEEENLRVCRDSNGMSGNLNKTQNSNNDRIDGTSKCFGESSKTNTSITKIDLEKQEAAYNSSKDQKSNNKFFGKISKCLSFFSGGKNTSSPDSTNISKTDQDEHAEVKLLSRNQISSTSSYQKDTEEDVSIVDVSFPENGMERSVLKSRTSTPIPTKTSAAGKRWLKLDDDEVKFVSEQRNIQQRDRTQNRIFKTRSIQPRPPISTRTSEVVEITDEEGKEGSSGRRSEEVNRSRYYKHEWSRDRYGRSHDRNHGYNNRNYYNNYRDSRNERRDRDYSYKTRDNPMNNHTRYRSRSPREHYTYRR